MGGLQLTLILKTFTNKGSSVPVHKTYDAGVLHFDTKWWWQRGPTAGLDLVAERESLQLSEIESHLSIP